MPGGAHKVAAILRVRLGVNEGIVAINVLDLALLPLVSPIHNLNNIALANTLALRVQRRRELAQPLLGDRRVTHVDYLAVHRQYAEGLLLQPHYNAHRVRVDLHQVAPLKMPERIHPGRRRLAQLQEALKHRDLLHRQIRQDYSHIVVDAHNQTRLPLISTTDHLFF